MGGEPYWQIDMSDEAGSSPSLCTSPSTEPPKLLMAEHLHHKPKHGSKIDNAHTRAFGLRDPVDVFLNS